MLPTVNAINLPASVLLDAEITYKKPIEPRARIAGEVFNINLTGTGETAKDNNRMKLLYTNVKGKRITFSIRGLLFTNVATKDKAADSTMFAANYGSTNAEAAANDAFKEARNKEIVTLHKALTTDADADDTAELEFPEKFKIVNVEPLIMENTGKTKKWPFYMYTRWETMTAALTPVQVNEFLGDFTKMSAIYAEGFDGLLPKNKATAEDTCQKVITLVEI